MAIIRKLEKIDFNILVKHSEVAATYSIVKDVDGFFKLILMGQPTDKFRARKVNRLG